MRMHSLYISRKRFFLVIIWLLIILVEYIFIKNYGMTSYGNNSGLAALIFCVLCLQLISLRISGIPMVSFFTIFLVLLYFFHFGQLFCMAIVDDSMFSVANMFRTQMGDINITNKTIMVSAMSINGVFLGGLFSHKFPNEIYSDRTIDEEFDSLSFKICFQFAKVAFWISLPLRLYIDMRQFIGAVVAGYSATADFTVSGIVSCIAGFWYVSVALLAICIQNKKTRKIVTNIFLGYMFITMLIGARGHQLVNIIGIILVLYYANETKIKLSSIIKYAVLGFAILTLINMILMTRGESISYLFNNFGLVMTAAVKNNVVIQTLTELGATIRTPYLVIRGKGNLFSPFFGETIFRSLLACIPGIDAIIPNTQSAIFSRTLNSAYHITGLGGSFVGEMYYDFGNLYWVFSILVGFIHCNLSNRIITSLKQKNLREICLYLPFLMYSLWWVRDTFCGLARSVVWLLLLYYIVRGVCLRNKSMRA